MVYNKFCESKKCAQCIHWDYMGPHTSCKLMGQTENIEAYPSNCPHLKEIQNWGKCDDSIEKVINSDI